MDALSGWLGRVHMAPASRRRSSSPWRRRVGLWFGCRLLRGLCWARWRGMAGAARRVSSPARWHHAGGLALGMLANFSARWRCCCWVLPGRAVDFSPAATQRAGPASVSALPRARGNGLAHLTTWSTLRFPGRARKTSHKADRRPRRAADKNSAAIVAWRTTADQKWVVRQGRATTQEGFWPTFQCSDGVGPLGGAS